MKVCAKYSEANYSNSVRPVKTYPEEQIRCADGLKACIDSIENTFCVDSLQSCPITAIAWTLSDMSIEESSKYV